MKYIEFGKNDVKLSTVVLGMMRISSLSPKEVEKLIETALDSGINSFDLADCYGDGLCERIVGKVLSTRPDLRDRMWIQSKCGIRNEDGIKYFDFSKEHITEAIDGILMRLNTDHIDSLLLHRPDTLMEPAEINEA
ncbi:MAG: aldo/keto reductase, partial [Clostridiales bacterium]|nr:aldo/keto reductase [Clostridiales bacterium]